MSVGRDVEDKEKWNLNQMKIALMKMGVGGETDVHVVGKFSVHAVPQKTFRKALCRLEQLVSKVEGTIVQHQK